MFLNHAFPRAFSTTSRRLGSGGSQTAFSRIATTYGVTLQQDRIGTWATRRDSACIRATRDCLTLKNADLSLSFSLSGWAPHSSGPQSVACL
jgi:hypothetical protein